MIVIKAPRKFHDAVTKARSRRLSVGFVPTMGALHQGHLSLIRAARRENDRVAVSIFVNPPQFAEGEDFRKYPRSLEADLALCRREKVDYVFTPDERSMYPEGFSTTVTVGGLSNVLCGISRPGHFCGVATVVTKLLQITSPERLYLGQKDAQQAVIIKRLVKDLHIPVAVRVLPIVREKDGLALSSRNRYLSVLERQDARVLYEALVLAGRMIGAENIGDAGLVRRRVRRLIQRVVSARIDYVEIVDPDNLEPLKRVSGRCLVALAVWIGKTRLIDNMIIKKGRGPSYYA